MFRSFIDIESLKAKAEDKEQADDAVKTIVTAFPKNPPPPGIAYSKNFARFQRYGSFAIQIRD
jgi:hypothetical protein